MNKFILKFFGFISLLFFAGLFFFNSSVAQAQTPPTVTIWSSSATPTTPSDNDTNSVELGLKFKSDVDGQVTGVRFYKGTGNTGTHIGNLWSSTGTNLATVTFSGESATGWQQANFSTPVTITANTTYVVSYHAPVGRYAGDNNYFAATGFDNAPLHALKDGISGANGVYLYGAGGFPTNTYQSSNYWVDVVFQAVSPTPTPTSVPTPTPVPANTKIPLLVITSSANPFSNYYSEILRAEGLNEFQTKDIATVTASDLANYDAVLLSETPLTSSQVAMFTTWVNGGGNLIAMRPDKQLAGLLGLTDASTTLTDKYLLVNTTSGPGVGIVNQTIQFHSVADLYTLSGATSVASLYSSATIVTTSPAVTMRTVGTNGGHAEAFTYDLAKSVIYTRQGNPAWAGQERDGAIPSVVRPDDMFFGAKVGDVQPDWIDLNKVSIPQADEQQRLLANMITQVNLSNKPMPRFWYMPNGSKAALIYTLDDHANVGAATQTVFDKLSTNSPAGCSVANWQCYRGTSWFYLGIPLTDSQASAYNSSGFEMGAHVKAADGGCTNFTSFADLDSNYVSQLSQLQSAYPSLPVQTTHRYHCIVWSDWLTQAKVELSHGIRFDMDYYYWPSSWINGRPGLFTGSGIPMRFADTSGATIDSYQGVSNLVNENGIDYDTDVFTLLNNATGANGYYGFFGTHDDYRDGAFSDSIINAAKTFNVPIITAKQALNWLDGRNSSTFSAFSWNGSTLNFTVSVGSGAQNIQAMLPAISSTNKALSSLTVAGSPVTFSTKTIKGISYAFFPAAAGVYTAVYNGVPTTPTPTPPGATSSLWDNSIVPNSPSGNSDLNGVEVGVKFKSDVAGQVTGVKFYKGTGNIGTHVGHLWDPTNPGTPLASVTFSGETASGWQQANFSTPVTITANTAYVVSYYAPSGHYAADSGYFTTNYDNVPLHASGAASPTVNGFYAYTTTATGTFPVNTSPNGANYWADVIFVPGAAPTPTPTVTPTPTPVVLPTATPTPAAALTIWSPATTPANSSSSDTNSVELGLKFKSDVAGQVTGVRFYKGTGNTGTHIGNLWSSTGTNLATVTFTGESATGWQQANFSTPVTITANTTYVVSYHAPVGRYAGDNNYFATTGFDNAPLHALKDGISGANGVYLYGAGGFPTNTYQSSNYWVDVVVQSGSVAPTPTPTPIVGPTSTPVPPTTTPTPGTTVNSTIWSSSVVPGTPSANDPNAVELGLKFKSDVAGQVTGVRFYKGSGNTGTHIGKLWSSTGALLASATFIGETASGWQQVNFSTPVAITASTTYVVSYLAPNGGYAGDNNYFAANGFDNAPLHALANGVSGGNGVYLYGGGFPTNSYLASNYWVDVILQH